MNAPGHREADDREDEREEGEPHDLVPQVDGLGRRHRLFVLVRARRRCRLRDRLGDDLAVASGGRRREVELIERRRRIISVSTGAAGTGR
jgi:hypothetical protein